MRHIFYCAFLIGFSALMFSCSHSAASLSEDSPTGAYKRLYTAVKAKNTDDIKATMTKKTLDFAAMASAQQKKPIEQVLENGFTQTTFSPEMPQIRDERINGDMGAVEVYRSKDKTWEDLPFIREDGAWKLAIGELFAGTYKSPGKGQFEKEKEASNAMSNTMVPMNMPANANANVPPKLLVPKAAANAK
jgi:hypothetical protein